MSSACINGAGLPVVRGRNVDAGDVAGIGGPGFGVGEDDANTFAVGETYTPALGGGVVNAAAECGYRLGSYTSITVKAETAGLLSACAGVVPAAGLELDLTFGEGPCCNAGEDDGFAAGEGLGLTVGVGVGLCVGEIVGLNVGVKAGFAVGVGEVLTAGEGLGFAVGVGVGLCVGEIVGLDVGVKAGFAVGVGEVLTAAGDAGEGVEMRDKAPAAAN